MTEYIDWPCNQTAVYWGPGSEETGGFDYDDYGKPQYTDPVEVDCRWDNITEEMIMGDGTRDFSVAQVIVATSVSVRGVLFLGELTDLTDADNPKNNEGAYEIRRVSITPSVNDGDEFLVVAYL